ncbi:putative gustatory receptor 28a isoform X2 [Coccinella septempunctata]|uniref:putative gustatory receptor 28a isoform X2 n=1 Tax=Coccinella septempunctata TaxID=41139 RepID=UPI001D06A1B2|nr:putative gustatory receptor 28a isoform X2 [Coccinella septempunctata]
MNTDVFPVKYFKRNMFGLQISVVTCFVSIEITLKLIHTRSFSFYEFFHHLNWILVSYKHALEGEFLALVLGEIKGIFSILGERIRQETNIINFSNNKRDLLLKINSIRKISSIHFSLVDSVIALTSVLTFDTYLWLIMNIIHLIHSCHFVIDSILRKKLSLYHQLWSFHEILKNCLVIYIWTSLSDEANRSVIILHDIWNKYADCGKIDSQIRYLQFISLRFMTSKLKFTAYGFFPLDWTFLHTVLAVTTTYIIILIQLRY